MAGLRGVVFVYVPTPDNFETTKRAPGSGTVARAVEVTGCIQ